MLYQGGGRKILTLWDRWTCANGKEWSQVIKEVLIIGSHMDGKDEFGSFNLETLKFQMHFREPGSSLYFIFIHTHIFFFSRTNTFLSLYSFFICFPWTLNYIVPISSPMLRRLLVLGQRGDRDKVGTRNIFPLERYLIFNFGTVMGSSLNWRSILNDRLWSRGKHKRW
jgi:hypothetical protein